MSIKCVKTCVFAAVSPVFGMHRLKKKKITQKRKREVANKLQFDIFAPFFQFKI